MKLIRMPDVCRFPLVDPWNIFLAQIKRNTSRRTCRADHMHLARTFDQRVVPVARRGHCTRF